MGTNSFIQVPPDSTGKKIYHQQHTIDLAPQQVPVVHIADPADPTKLQRVDNYGSALVAYADGAPTIDAAGRFRTSNAKPIGSYDFAVDPQDSLFSDVVVSGGTVVYSPQQSSMVLTTNTTNGSSASRTTNRYHYHQVGTANMAYLSVALGDTGKANNNRRWGVGESINGIFYEMHGTELLLGIYSDTGGTLSEREVLRTDWNIDKLDGTGPSGFVLDVTKRNLYWLDYLWPAGSVHAGVYDNSGQRIVAHTFTIAESVPFTRVAAMPITVVNENFGVTSSSSEIRYLGSSIYSEGITDYVYWRFSDMENPSLKTTTTNTPLLTVKSKLIDADGHPNRVNAYPELLNIFVTGGAAKVDFYYGLDEASLTGATWNLAGASTLLGDTTSTAVTVDPLDGSKMCTWYVDVGSTTLDMAKHFETNDIGICLPATGAPLVYSVVVTALTGTATTARATLSYRELS